MLWTGQGWGAARWLGSGTRNMVGASISVTYRQMMAITAAMMVGHCGHVGAEAYGVQTSDAPAA